MKTLGFGSIITFAVLAYYGYFERIGITWFRPIPSIARVEVDGNKLIVSDGPQSQALFVSGKTDELSGVLTDYSFGGIGPYAKIGARGIIGLLTTNSYKDLFAEHENSGVCMANLLMDHGVPHLFLIPHNREALLSMRKMIGRMGKNVTLSGQHLIFQSATVGGEPLDEPESNMPIEYFLVDSIAGG